MAQGTSREAGSRRKDMVVVELALGTWAELFRMSQYSLLTDLLDEFLFLPGQYGVGHGGGGVGSGHLGGAV